MLRSYVGNFQVELARPSLITIFLDIIFFIFNFFHSNSLHITGGKLIINKNVDLMQISFED